MKRILFVVTYFDCGGICRSLQNLLNVIDPKEYEIDVFGLVESGMFKNIGFSNCKIVPESKLLSSLYSRYDSLSGLKKVPAFLSKILSKITKGRYNNSILRKEANRLVNSKTYDAVIAFSEGVVTKFLSYVDHPNKIGWIHCDYQSYYRINNNADESQIYDSYKAIVCVSEYTKSSFTDIYPAFTKKTHAVYNILDDEMMRSLATCKVSAQHDFDSRYFNIVSVGRLDEIKRLSIIPSIANDLRSRGHRFRWYVIGPKGGNPKEYDKLMADIERHNLYDTVLYLGEQSNPYPFIKQADLLVNTSISEACPYVINESKILGTPVICTNFGSANEFIENGETGMIAPIEEMADTINYYMSDSKLQDQIKENLSKFSYNNGLIFSAFSKLID